MAISLVVVVVVVEVLDGMEITVRLQSLKFLVPSVPKNTQQ
jgi:hypothetical protein